MREKYESLSLATLKDLAKARGLKGVSALRKPELIERMLHEDELEGETKKQETTCPMMAPLSISWFSHDGRDRRLQRHPRVCDHQPRHGIARQDGLLPCVLTALPFSV